MPVHSAPFDPPAQDRRSARVCVCALAFCLGSQLERDIPTSQLAPLRHVRIGGGPLTRQASTGAREQVARCWFSHSEAGGGQG